MEDFIKESIKFWILDPEKIAGAVLTIITIVGFWFIRRLPPEMRPSKEKFTCATAVWLLIAVVGFMVVAVVVLLYETSQ